MLACWRRACTSWLISDTSATTEDTEAGYMGAAFVDVEDEEEWQEWVEQWVEP